MEIELDYGEGKLKVELDENRVLHILENKPVDPLKNTGERFLECFRKPTRTPPLKDLISGKKKI